MRTLIFICLIIFAQTKIFAQTDEYCINAEERKLYKLIDDYRGEKNLHTIPVSRALTQLAKMHAKDIVNNRPPKATTSIHSWTNKGKWKACDYTNDSKGMSCMTDKAAELTSYKHKAFELIAYNENGDMTADFAMKDWKNNSVYGFMLINKTGWQDKNWEAIGIAVYKNVAVVWLGENTDKSGAPVACPDNFEMKPDPVVTKTEEKTPTKTEEVKPSVVTSDREYLVVYGSYESSENAQNALSKLSSSFPDAYVKEGDGRFRVILASFKSNDEAENAKKTLKGKYREAWIWEK
jgi:hypothetical protein